MIPGGVESYGTLRACDAAIPDRCEAPDVREGGRLTVVVTFSDPDTGQVLFPEVIEFVADTVPPVVEETAIVSGALELVATDLTT